jgi:hypothetical protein
MSSGFQEILLIGLIVLGIIFLPRLSGRRRIPSNEKRANPRTRVHLTGFLRLAIFVSITWLMATAAYLEPWERPGQQYLFVGAGPVALFWGIFWIAAGFRKHRKKPRDS